MEFQKKRDECEFIEDFFHKEELNAWLVNRFEANSSFFGKIVADVKMDLGSHPFDVIKSKKIISFAKKNNLTIVDEIKEYYFKNVSELPPDLSSGLKGIEKQFKTIDVDFFDTKQASLNCEFIEYFFSNKKLNKWLVKQYGEGNGFGKALHNIVVLVDYHPFDIIKIKRFESLAKCHNFKCLDDIIGFYDMQSSLIDPEKKAEITKKNYIGIRSKI